MLILKGFAVYEEAAGVVEVDCAGIPLRDRLRRVTAFDGAKWAAGAGGVTPLVNAGVGEAEDEVGEGAEEDEEEADPSPSFPSWRATGFPPGRATACGMTVVGGT